VGTIDPFTQAQKQNANSKLKAAPRIGERH
jgi:hypothetical protein